MLTQAHPLEQLRSTLIPREDWRPFPTAAERDAWEALPDSLRGAHLKRGEALLGYEWPLLSAARFLDFARDGNRSRYEAIRNARRNALRDLALAECMEGQGRFIDDIVNGIWTTCEESYWGVPAHIRMQQAGPGLPDTAEPTVDLFAAETVALLAWTVYLLGPQLDGVSPLIVPRILRESEYRILTPNLERDDFWWMGFDGSRAVNNWNPWINSNWLTAALLLEGDPARRLAAVGRILKSLDSFTGIYFDDGGCDEGPSYWGRAAASLFDCLELLHSATGGAIDHFADPLIRNMGRFIYRTHIHNDYFVNFADASAIVQPAASLVYRYGVAIGDDDMAAFGAWLAERQQIGRAGFAKGESLARVLPALFAFTGLQGAKPRQPLPRDTWLDGIQVVTARDHDGSERGFFLAAKGGHNAESHNHNDIGNFVVYIDGKPVILDAGVETYTRKTFGPQRYEIWTMQSAYHSLLPAIDGVQQAPGEAYKAGDVAYQADDAGVQFSLDIAPAYPPEARLNTWRRTITFNRGQDVQISDTYALNEPAAEIVLSLLAAGEVSAGSPGLIKIGPAPFGDGLESGAAQVYYDAGMFAVSTETVPILDERMGGVWGGSLTRVVFKAANPPQQATWTWQVKSNAA
jgi:hypothetical protein